MAILNPKFDNGKLYAYGEFSHNTIDDTFEKSPTKFVNRGNLFSRRRRKTKRRRRRRGGTKKNNLHKVQRFELYITIHPSYYIYASMHIYIYFTFFVNS